MQIVLLEDDFGNIIDGIREGRLIFENLKKCIAYTLSSNIPEIFPFLLFIAAGWPLAIETIMIMLIDMGTDVGPAVSVAYEEPEDNIMSLPPRAPDAHLVGVRNLIVVYGTIGIFETIACYVGFFYTFGNYGFTVRMLAHTMAWSDTRTEYKHMVGVEEKDVNRRYFEDQCMVNDFWFQHSGTGLWGTKEPDIDKDYVDVPKLKEVNQTKVARCSDNTTVTAIRDRCFKIFGTVNITDTTVDPVGKALDAVYGNSSKEGTADRVAEASTLRQDTAKCLSAKPFALVAQAFARKDAAAVVSNLAAVTLDKLQCGELQTYSIETIGPVRRPLQGYDEHLCELSSITAGNGTCPLVFSIGKDVNPAGPKLVTIVSARCGQHFFYFRTFVLSRAQSSFMVTVIWGQIGHILTRKTQMSSIFGFFQKNTRVLDQEASKEAGKAVHKAATEKVWRLTDNRMMTYAILQELILIILLVWVPKFNAVFLFEQINVSEGWSSPWCPRRRHPLALLILVSTLAVFSALAVYAAVVALWILPFMLLWEEARKFLIRIDSKKEKGIVGRLTYF